MNQAVVVHESSCPVEEWNDAVRGKVTWRTLLSADRTPTSQMTLGVADLGPGQPNPFRLHRHEATEIYYVLSGEGVVSIDGAEHPLRAGSSVFIPGNVLHGARNTGGETLRLLYVFAVDSFSDVEYAFSGAETASTKSHQRPAIISASDRTGSHDAYSDGFAKGFAEVTLAHAGARRLVEHFLDAPESSSDMAIHAIARQHAEAAADRHTATNEDEYARGYADGRTAAQRG